jgi:hypothetical protein
MFKGPLRFYQFAGLFLLFMPLFDRLRRPLEMNTDAAFYLQCGQLMLAGKVPYVDFMDFGPPLIMYMNIPPAALSQWLNIPPTLAFSICVWLLVGFLTVIAWWQIHRLAGKLPLPMVASFIVALPIITMVMLFQYGQRDFLGIYFILPLFFMRLQQSLVTVKAEKVEKVEKAEKVEKVEKIEKIEKAEKDPTASAADTNIARETGFARETGKIQHSKLSHYFVGFLGGFGCCLRPECVIPVLLVEAFAFFSARRNPPGDGIASKETPGSPAFIWQFNLVSWVGLFSAGALYGLCFLSMPKAALDQYFQFVMPLLARGYHCYDCTLTEVLFYPFIAAPALILILLAASFLMRRLPLSRLFILWCLAGYLLCVAYHTFMPHHIILMEAGGVLLAAVLIAGLTTDSPGRSSMIVPVSVLAACAASLITVLRANDISVMRFPESVRLRQVLSEMSGPNDRVAFLGTSVAKPYPMMASINRLPATRYLFLFPISMAQYIRAHDPSQAEKMQALQERVYKETAEDLAKNQPKLVFVYAGVPSQGCDPDFNLKQWFEKHGLLSGPLAHYKYVENVADYDLYRRQ